MSDLPEGFTRHSLPAELVSEKAPGQMQVLQAVVDRLASATVELARRLDPVLDKYLLGMAVEGGEPQAEPGSELLRVVAQLDGLAGRLEELGRAASL